MPGLTIRAAMSSKTDAPDKSWTSNPSLSATSRAAGLSSHARTCAPPARNARAADRPDRPNPKTAMRCPATPCTSIMPIPLPHFQCRQPDHRKDQGNDPKPDHDLRLGPALFLVVMMNRRHQEHALAGAFEIEHLNDHAQRFD